METAAKNFIYTGDIHSKALSTVAMRKLCKPVMEGGIGIRSLREFNQAGLFKLACNFLKKNKQWAVFMHARFFNRGMPIGYYKSSSIWFGLEEAVQTLKMDVFWNVGSNSNCRIWYEDWTAAGALIDVSPIPAELWYTREMTVGDFTVEGRIQLPQQLLDIFISNHHNISDIVVPLGEVEDELVWEGAATGIVTVKSAYEFYRDKGTRIEWYKKIWQQYIPPKNSIFVWKCLRDSLPTEDSANKKGVVIDGGCTLCDDIAVLEDQQHIFIECHFARMIWDWLSTLIHLDLSFIASVRIKRKSTLT